MQDECAPVRADRHIGAVCKPATGAARYRVGVPRFWIWTQALICIFVLAGMVIAITKLA